MEKHVENLMFDPTGYFEFKQKMESNINLEKLKKAEKKAAKAMKEKDEEHRIRILLEKQKAQAEKKADELEKKLNLILQGFAYDEESNLVKG